ncbi:MAG TPA: J domain-containing protein [Bacteroidia bacterium]
MIEHNYYKLFELEAFASIDQIKRRYRELAMVYHPDRNPGNPSAEEYFKIITQGYNLLSEPEKKVVYDSLLNQILDKVNYSPNDSNRVVTAQSKAEEVRDKIIRHRENKRNTIIKEFEYDEEAFKHKHRYYMAILSFAGGVLLAYNNWYINYYDFKVLLVVVGSFLFGLGAYKISDIRYRQKLYLRAKEKRHDFMNVTGPIKLFVILFLMTPISFLVLMKVTKIVHLNYFYDYTVVENFANIRGTISYSYKVDDVDILRETQEVPPSSVKQQLRVKYSRLNPVISELVSIEQIEAQKKNTLR